MYQLSRGQYHTNVCNSVPSKCPCGSKYRGMFKHPWRLTQDYGGPTPLPPSQLAGGHDNIAYSVDVVCTSQYSLPQTLCMFLLSNDAMPKVKLWGWIYRFWATVHEFGVWIATFGVGLLKYYIVYLFMVHMNTPEQSIRFCSERETSFPVALKCCPSRDPVVLKAQHEPHWPCWVEIRVTHEETSTVPVSDHNPIRVSHNIMWFPWQLS